MIIKKFFCIMVLLSMHDMRSSMIDAQNLAKQRAMLRLQRQRTLAMDLTELGQVLVARNRSVLDEAGQSPVKDIRAKLAQNHAQHQLCVQRLQGLHRRRYEDEIRRVGQRSKSVKLPSIEKERVRLELK